MNRLPVSGPDQAIQKLIFLRCLPDIGVLAVIGEIADEIIPQRSLHRAFRVNEVGPAYGGQILLVKELVAELFAIALIPPGFAVPVDHQLRHRDHLVVSCGAPVVGDGALSLQITVPGLMNGQDHNP